MSAKVLVTGASGKLGAYIVKALRERGREVVAWSGRQVGEVCGVALRPVELGDPSSLATAFEEAQATHVVHCAAVSTISGVYQDYETALRVNRDATSYLAERAGRLVYTSTDLLFDGRHAPYSEDAPVVPASRYGMSKFLGEESVRNLDHVIIARMSLMFGPTLFGSSGFFDKQIGELRAGREICLFEDEWRTPLAFDEAASSLLELLDGQQKGLFHIAGAERLSRYDMGVGLARVLGVNESLVKAGRQADVQFPEPRPRDVSLRSNRPWNSRRSGYEEALRRILNGVTGS